MNALDELNARLGIGQSRPKLPVALVGSGYEAERLLGKGSFGNAYLVRHKERGKNYVVKHVNMSNMTSRQRKDAHQEIVVLQQLNYPNIIRYEEFFEDFPHLYIVMEYADGGDVYSHLKNLRKSMWALGSGRCGGLTEEQVISLFVQTTMAVKYMHDRRLLHRDIKSQNVFLTQNHVVKLGDFGISTVLMSTVAMAKTMCGTPCYFSPELCLGKPYNNKSDVWALGVLLYELCTTGRLPFEANTMNRLMDEICKREPRRIPSSFSDELWQLILWMLQKDPKQRPDADQILRTPVLVRAIPSVVKKMSELDTSYESEYKCVLTPGAKPPSPIKNRLSLIPSKFPAPQKGERLAGGVAGAGAAGATPCGVSGARSGVGMLGHVDLFRRRNGDYPFIRVGEELPKPKMCSPANSPVSPSRLPAARKMPPQVSPLLKAEEPPPRQPARQLPLAYGMKNGRTPLQGESYENRDEPNVKTDEKPTPIENEHEKNIVKKMEYPSPAQQRLQLKHSFGRTPLQELFLLYDANKKRIIERRERRANPEDDGAKNANATPKENPPAALPVVRNPSVKPNAEHDRDEKIYGKEPIHIPPLKVEFREVAAAERKELPAVERGAAAAAAAAGGGGDGASGGQKDNVFRGNQQQHSRCADTTAAKVVDELRGDLARVLKEMAEHFEHVQAATNGSENTRNPSVTRSPSVLSNSPAPDNLRDAENTGGEGEVGQDFSDALGTTLDVQELRRKPVSPAEVPAEVAKGYGIDERIPLFIEQYEAALPGRNIVAPHVLADAARKGGKEDGNDTNKDAVGVKGIPNSPAVVSSHSPKVTSPSTAKEKGADDLVDPLFTGGCLCNSVNFVGHISYIFGSFVCNCTVCLRFSGSVSGVEWMHLPDIPFEVLFTGKRNHGGGAFGASPTSSPVAGAGVAAAQALSNLGESPPARRALQGTKEGGDGASASEVRLPQNLTEYAVELPMLSDDGAMVDMTYKLYSCSKCGSSIAMEHGNIEGSVVAKAALSAESLALLELFQQTVPLDGVATAQ